MLLSSNELYPYIRRIQLKTPTVTTMAEKTVRMNYSWMQSN
jgi:hypothetical protein